MVGLINKEDIYDIADAIREKTQTEDTFKPSEMGDLIRSIRVIPENSYQLKEIESTPTSLATFDADALPMLSLKVGIEPQQDLHGYDYPWAGGAGKNKLPLDLATIKRSNTIGTWNGNAYTINGITFTVHANVDGSVTDITANGTATANANLYLLGEINSNEYPFAGMILNGGASSNEYVRIELSSPPWAAYATSGINEGTIDPAVSQQGTNKIITFLRVLSGYTSSNSVFKPMIRLASVSDAAFAPYSNICPISGWDEANITVADDDTDPTVSNVYTINLDGTRYGGTLDVVSGELKVVPYYASYNGETLEGEWISDRDVYAVGTTPTIGAQVVNIGATPQTIQLTPTQVKSLLGSNNIWADTGDILEGEYFKAL